MRQQNWRNYLLPVRPHSGGNCKANPCLTGQAMAALLLLAVCCAGAVSSAQAQAVRNNPGFQAASIPRNDDGSTDSAIDLGFDVNFFGANFRSAFVNNNGNITFGGSLSTFTPQGLVASPLRIIAPFWGDVDTRASGSALVTYGQDIVDGRPAFGANWVNVGYFGSHDDKLNSFQLVLIDRSDIAPGDFDIEFNYDRIEWETGDASGGSGGFGGTSASAGYSNGEGKPESSFEILGSRINGVFLDSNRNGLRFRRLNSAQRGRLVFFVRSGFVGCTFSILSLTLDYPWEGGPGALQIAAPFGCEWEATSSAGFVTITTAASGSGSAIIEFEVAPNRTLFRRSATLTVAGQTIVIVQEAFVTLSMTPPAVTISSVDGGFSSRVALQLDAISGTVDWFASTALLSGESWTFRLTPSFGTVTAGTPETVILELNPGFLPPTSGNAAITVVDATNGPSIIVPITLDVSPSGGRLILSQSSFTFRARQGGSLPASQTLELLNAGTGSLNWAIDNSAQSSHPWLSFSTVAGVATTGSDAPSRTVLSANPVGLDEGIYQALVPVTAPSASYDTPLISVTLQVVAPDAAPIAETSPAGLLFVREPGGGAPANQKLYLANQGAGNLDFQLEPITDAGGNWLFVSANSGSISTVPTAVDVAVSTASLPSGIYHGRIVATYSTGKAQLVEVVLVVAPTAGRTLLGSLICQPQGITMVAPTVGTGADLAVSFPAPLSAILVDSCGNVLNNATVYVTVEGQVIPLPAAGEGIYRGVWTPEQTAPFTTVKFFVLHPQFGNFDRSVQVSVVPAPGDEILPVVAANGVIDAAGFAALRPLAPGGMVIILGSGFADEELAASQVPLERELGGVSVQMGSENVPLFSVGPFEIKAQVPFTAVQGARLSIVVHAHGRQSAPQSYLVGAVLPGLFNIEGVAVALDSQSQPITPSNPALLGDTLHLLAAGLGITDPAVATGEAAPSATTVIDPVSVSIGGEPVPVIYQGLDPGSVGIYRVTVGLPGNLTPGGEVPVVIRQNGIASNSVSIPLAQP